MEEQQTWIDELLKHTEALMAELEERTEEQQICLAELKERTEALLAELEERQHERESPKPPKISLSPHDSPNG